MNRRNFFGTVLGGLLAPVVIKPADHADFTWETVKGDGKLIGCVLYNDAPLTPNGGTLKITMNGSGHFSLK